MKIAIDVNYNKDNTATVAGVVFNNWQDKKASNIIIAKVDNIAPYISGKFYKRELPCILALLEKLVEKPEYIIIDGYIYLNNYKMGLGAHLYQALNEKIPVIGVAKSPFQDVSADTFIYRGKSKKPLYITSAGIELEQAKQLIQQMHGEYRMPTLLKKVDRVCRGNL